MPVLSVWITENIVTYVIEASNSGAFNRNLIFLILANLSALVISNTSTTIMRYLNIKMELKLNYYFLKKVSQKSSSSPLIYFENPEFFHHYERIQGDLGRKFLSPIENIFSIISSIISIIALSIYLFKVHVLVVILSLIAGIPTFLLNAKYGNLKFYLLKNQTPLARMARYISALLNDRHAIKEIRIFNSQKYLLDKWSKAFKRNNKEFLDLNKKKEIKTVLLNVIIQIVNAFNIIIMITLMIQKKINVGTFVAAFSTIPKTSSEIENLSVRVAQIHSETLYISDLFSFLEYKDQRFDISTELKSGEFPLPLEEGIYFDNISFSYPNSGREALQNLSFKIEAGKKTAIVGENGSGKTTLVKCLMGVYPIEKGCIYFDDVNIDNLSKESLYNNITVIFQDFIKYNFSLKENITIGNINEINNFGRLIESASLSGVEEFAPHLEKKYDTILGKVLMEGEDLSIGQWQKIALARALFKGGEIYIFDEPTAALDPKSEIKLFEKFDTLSKNKTSLFISHRMASARMADKIIVMEKGRIVEEGSHSELMNLKGKYCEMYDAQSKWYN
ncbi:MAG: ABC transporter ATP-binding protein [Bacillota bacterium]